MGHERCWQGRSRSLHTRGLGRPRVYGELSGSLDLESDLSIELSIGLEIGPGPSFGLEPSWS